MGRLVTAATLGTWLLSGAAGAADLCRTACLATRGTCLADAATAFATAKATCPTTKPDRRTCLASARQTRAAARNACRSTAEACKLGCPASPGPVCGMFCTAAVTSTTLSPLSTPRRKSLKYMSFIAIP